MGLDRHLLREMFFRTPVTCRYHGNPHEEPSEPGRVTLDGITFKERDKTPEEWRARFEMTVSEMTPDTSRSCFYIGDALEWLGYVEQAARTFEHGASLTDFAPEKGWLMWRAARCWQRIGDLDRALEICCVPERMNSSGWPEFWWLSAVIILCQGRPQQAIYNAECALLCCKGKDPSKAGRCTYRYAWYEGPKELIRLCQDRLSLTPQ